MWVYGATPVTSPTAKTSSSGPSSATTRQRRVDRERGALVEPQAEAAEPEAGGAGAPAGGDEHAVGVDGLAALRDHPGPCARPTLDAFGGVAEPHVDAVRAQRLGECLAGPLRLTVEERRRRVEQRDPRPEPRVGLRELAADGTGPDHRQPGRQLGARERLVARPGRRRVEARQGRHERFAARGDDEGTPPGQLTVADLQTTARDDLTAAAQERHARLLELAGGAGVVAVLRGLVTPPDGHRPRHAPRGRQEQRLAGDAREVRALAAHQTLFEHGNGLPRPGQLGREALAARPRAQHDDVELRIIGRHRVIVPLRAADGDP